ncbi:hypothetical protein [Streptomyces sp. XY332]|uniref:hypothetical protein n=1 Tax=Streptomyces sp. XY332 TaxID=1415561 RepID=UPI0006B1BC7C|nr:hypothetical protein [Streptomyces sp. XY332]KOY60004.1 lipoprotein [Streptomyces sp. XY332]
MRAFSFPAAVSASFPAAVSAALIALALLPLLAGCGDAGGPVGAGATPTASGPVQLWPDRKGASVPPADPEGAPPVYVQGLAPVRDQNVHEVDPVALVQAELRAGPDTGVGPAGMPPQTVAAIEACGQEGQPPGKCPVLTPYYRDLTGNGRDELVVGIELPDRMMSVRAYTADPDGRLNRIMATTQTVVGVELAGQDVILRVPSGNPGYELITAWSWAGKQHTMLPTREQIVRLPGTAPSASPSPPKPLQPSLEGTP